MPVVRAGAPTWRCFPYVQNSNGEVVAVGGGAHFRKGLQASCANIDANASSPRRAKQAPNSVLHESHMA
jgi:hypothetical protein